MEKLLRILFVMSAFTFITTVTACRTTELLGITEPSAGSDNTKTIAGNDNTETAKQPDQLQVDPIEFLIEPPTDNTGITVDETEDVVKVTIKPSLLTYAAGTHRAPIFTVTFKNNEKGLIIPTHDPTNIEILHNQMVRSQIVNNTVNMFADQLIDQRTYGYLTDRNTPGFTSLANNPGWRKAAGRTNTLMNREAYLICETTVTGINEKSYGSLNPAVSDDLAFGNDTKIECFLNIKTHRVDTDVLKKAARKNWAANVIELDLADPDIDRNLHSVSFLGIETGDAKASDISKLVSTFVRTGINEASTTPAEIKKLTDVYANKFLKVEIVIAEAK